MILGYFSQKRPASGQAFLDADIIWVWIKDDNSGEISLVRKKFSELTEPEKQAMHIKTAAELSTKLSQLTDAQIRQSAILLRAADIDPKNGRAIAFENSVLAKAIHDVHRSDVRYLGEPLNSSQRKAYRDGFSNGCLAPEERGMFDEKSVYKDEEGLELSTTLTKEEFAACLEPYQRKDIRNQTCWSKIGDYGSKAIRKLIEFSTKMQNNTVITLEQIKKLVSNDVLLSKIYKKVESNQTERSNYTSGTEYCIAQILKKMEEKKTQLEVPAVKTEQGKGILKS